MRPVGSVRSMADSHGNTEGKTYEVTLPEDEASRVEAYAAEREDTETEMIRRMVADYSALEAEGWLALRDTSDAENLTPLRLLYQGRTVRNALMLLAAVYGLFTLLIISLLVAASPESSVTSLEMVAAVGFLIVSVMVALIFLILLQTPFPEYLEERYL